MTRLNCYPRDISPIENMWSMVAQRLTQITPPAATRDQLWQRVEAAWSAVSQEHIQSLFESIPRHVMEEDVAHIDATYSRIVLMSAVLVFKSDLGLEAQVDVQSFLRTVSKIASWIFRERSACVIGLEISILLHNFPEESKGSQTSQKWSLTESQSRQIGHRHQIGREKCCQPGFIAKISPESQTLLKRTPTSKGTGLTLPAEGLQNNNKYSGHLLEISYFDGNPLNQDLIGVDEACVNKTLHMVPEEEV
ncbi:transposable element Tcb1 transposase [Trichonephila clavipes]|nr:transposable element Tcb1 transposase [Trichonephila clavipes]